MTTGPDPIALPDNATAAGSLSSRDWDAKAVADFLRRQRIAPSDVSPFAGIEQWNLGDDDADGSEAISQVDAGLLTSLARPQSKSSIIRLLPNTSIKAEYYGVDAGPGGAVLVECHRDEPGRIIATPDCRLPDICRDLAILLDTQHAGPPNGIAIRDGLTRDGLWTWAAILDFIRGVLLVSMLERSVLATCEFKLDQLFDFLKAGLDAPDLRWMTSLIWKTLESPPVAPPQAFRIGADELVRHGLLRRGEDGRFAPLAPLMAIAVDLLTPVPATLSIGKGRDGTATQRTLTMRGRSLWQLRQTETAEGTAPVYCLESVGSMHVIRTWVECLSGGAAPQREEKNAAAASQGVGQVAATAIKERPTEAPVRASHAMPEFRVTRSSQATHGKQASASAAKVPSALLLILAFVHLAIVAYVFADDSNRDMGQGNLVRMYLPTVISTLLIATGSFCALIGRMRSLAYVAGILGSIPLFTPLVIVGMPFGIWLLVALGKTPRKKPAERR